MINPNKQKLFKYDLFIAFSLFLISMVLRLINYTKLSTYVDEMIYYNQAYSILSYNWSWPFEDMQANPPFIPYVLAILTYLFGGGLEVFRLVSILAGSLSVYVMYFLGKKLFNRRVGILSAILLTFSSYHILYSKIIMLESTVIFFILTSIYYFYKSCDKKRDIKYACISGVFVGLATITKWVGLLLYPVFFIYILWTKKSFRSLLNKKFLILTTTSILVGLPVYISLFINNANPFYWQMVTRYQIAKGAMSLQYKSFGTLELITRGFNNYIDLLMDGSSPAALSLPWYPIFQLVSSLLLIITIIYYIPSVLKAKKNDSLIFMYFMGFNIFVAFFKTRFVYYLLWALPGFYIMLSNMVIEFIDHLKIRYKTKKFRLSIANSIRIGTIIFAIIFIISYIAVGSMAPFLNKGELIGYEKQILNIMNKINPNDAIAASLYHVTKFYIDKYQLKVHLFPIFYNRAIDIKMLNDVKPRFIIIGNNYYYSSLTDLRAKIVIYRDYNLISESYDMIVFERKQYSNIDNNNKEEQNQFLNSNIYADIYSYAFIRSIPEYMTIGKSYKVHIFVKNTGDGPVKFAITLDVPDEFIYSRSQNWKIITLDKGESYRVSFPITAIKPHTGELNITSNIYYLKAYRNIPSAFIQLDSATKAIRGTKTALSK